VHLRIGLAEEVDRVVHEFGQRLRCPLRDCHPSKGRRTVQLDASVQSTAPTDRHSGHVVSGRRLAGSSTGLVRRRERPGQAVG
jgi:hypothetical protein